MPKPSIEGRFAAAQAAIDSALADPTIQEALAPYGYTLERIREGQALRAAALAKQQEQQARYGDLFAANDALATAQQQAEDTFMRLIKVARVAFQGDRGAAQRLDLAPRKRALAGWLLQARQFFANTLNDPAILAALAEYGITRERLEADQALIDAVEARSVARNGIRGAAQTATRERDLALRAMDRWMGRFVQIARVALQDQPSALEKLGV